MLGIITAMCLSYLNRKPDSAVSPHGKAPPAGAIRYVGERLADSDPCTQPCIRKQSPRIHTQKDLTG